MTIKYDRKIEDIKKFMEQQGFYYSDEQIYNFYISLITKPFIILSGISGSGKSKIAELFAEYMSKSYGNNDNYELVSVKPNWTDSRGVFGYSNILNDTYAITQTLKIFIRALNNPSCPYFLMLDEMNLAKVEYYFSDFLSLLESRRKCKTKKYFFDDSKLDEVESLTLPKVTLLAAIDMNLFVNKAGIKDIRHNRIYKKWMDTHPSDVEKSNWTPRSRTEINSKDSSTGKPDRVSPKFFIRDNEDDELYMLIDSEEFSKRKREGIITEKNEELWNDLLKEYFISDRYEITQDQIVLHNESVALPSSGNGDSSGLKSWQESDLYDLDTNSYYVPPKISIPTNLFVIGTVNVDETTYMFSPKVLDRSNVLEFNDIDLYHAYGYGVEEQSRTKSYDISIDRPLNMNVGVATSNDTKIFFDKYKKESDILIDIYNILLEQNRHFGYRVFNEISFYILNYCEGNLLDDWATKALDCQVLQKVLPKLNGSEEELGEILKRIGIICEENGLLRSKGKIDKMEKTLKKVGYATFIE